MILNAANEVAVAAFLNDQLAYSEIAEVVDRALNRFSAVAVTKTLDDVIGLDCEVRNQMSELKKDCQNAVKGTNIAVEGTFKPNIGTSSSILNFSKGYQQWIIFLHSLPF